MRSLDGSCGTRVGMRSKAFVTIEYREVLKVLNVLGVLKGTAFPRAP
jgi:hypothetical protein